MKRRRRIASVPLADLKRTPARVARLAKRSHGVQVVDDKDGRYLFRLSIPSRPLSDR